MPVVSGDALLRLFPHRARNVLIDRADVPLTTNSTTGTGWLSISPGDAAGRDIILYEKDGSRFILSPFAAEYIALGSICVLAPDLGPGDVCFFSTISNVRFHRRVPAGETLRAEVTRRKDRGPFKRFTGTVFLDGGDAPVASADIMAFAMPAGSSAEQTQAEGKKVEPPAADADLPVPAEPFAGRHPALVFAHAVTHESESSITTRYEYPANHPFCEGHFPGDPVMMGVTQWQMAEDAFAVLAARRGLSGTVRGSAQVVRPDGTLVAEIKGLELDLSEGFPPFTTGLGKIAFRGMVTPGQTIFCRTVLEQQE